MCQYFSVRSRTGKYEYLRFVSKVQKTISFCMSLISCQEGVQFPSKENSTLFLCHRCMKGSLLRNGREWEGKMNLQYIRELWVNSQEGEGDVGRSAAVIFGVPTCVGNMSWQVKKWLGTNWNVQVGGKLGSAFSTDNSPNGGGAELAVPTPVNRMPFRGMRRHSSGAEFGRPFIHIGPAAVRDKIEEKEILYRPFGARVARKARQLFDGK